MAVTNGPQIQLRGDIGAEVGLGSSSNVNLNNASIRGLIGKASGAQNAMSEYYGASNVQFIGSGTVTGTVENDVYWNSYSYGARNGDLVVITGFTPFQLGSSGNQVNAQSGTARQHTMGSGTGNPAFNKNICSYVHNGVNGSERWYTNAIYAGYYASVGIQIFRGPTEMVTVSNGATANAAHVGWLVYDAELGNYYSESPPATIPALSGYTTSFNRYSGNIPGRASNGYRYDHFYSNRQRTQYVLGAGGTLTSDANSMQNKFELRS